METKTVVRFDPDELALLRRVWPFTGVGAKVLDDRAAHSRVDVLTRVRDGLLATRDRLLPGVDPQHWVSVVDDAPGAGSVPPGAVPLATPSDPAGFAADMAAGRVRDVEQIDAAVTVLDRALALLRGPDRTV